MNKTKNFSQKKKSAVCLFVLLPILFFSLSSSEYIFAAKRQWVKFLRASFKQSSQHEKITIFLEKKVPFTYNMLAEHSKKNLPCRLYIDLKNTRISRETKKYYAFHNSIVQKIRIAQNKPNITRVVLNLQRTLHSGEYQIYTRYNPFRVIVEILTSPKSSSTDKNPKLIPQKIPASNILKTQSTSVIKDKDKKQPERRHLKSFFPCTIVIDPGHGGKDPGAIGYRGIKEKDVTLAIALQLKKILDTRFQCRTILTRDRDIFIPLEKRTQIANQNNADLFISIHTNSHTNKRLTGIETYYLNFSSDDTARSVAARENFSTPAKVSDLELILFDLMQNSRINESSLLAGYIHSSLIEFISKKYRGVRNLGIKQAPFTVLLNADMPCILVETAFISNPSESNRLTSKTYQKVLSEAIADGISRYSNEVKTAYYRSK